MDKTQIPNFKKLENEVKRLLQRELPVTIGNMAENFFKDSFRNQGFTNHSLQPWKKTKSGQTNTFSKKSMGILIRSGNLRDTIRVTAASGLKIELTAGNQVVNYAKIHNEGGWLEIPVTDKSRRFFWRMYKATDEDMWKFMALSKKKSFRVHIPKRQFMGNSAMLNKEITHEINLSINEVKNKL